MSSAKNYLKNFFDEKDSIEKVFEVEFEGVNHIFSKEDVLTQLLSLDNKTLDKIRIQLVKIDFVNGDVNHFFKYVLKGFLEYQSLVISSVKGSGLVEVFK